jgi:two-component system, OmpR family, sensor histidine kinase KdpD
VLNSRLTPIVAIVLTTRATSYALAVVSVAVVTLVSMYMYPIDADFPPLVLLLAVALTASAGGIGPALVATALGFLSLDFYFEQPPFMFSLGSIGTAFDLVAFALVSVFLGTLNARLRNARRRAYAARIDAEQALLARDEALAIVSHDLRTPLTAIKTSVSTLRNPGTPLNEGTRTELLGTIEAEADRLVHFVGDALAMSRLESGITPDPQWNALGEIVSAVLDRVTPILGERPVTYDVPDTLPLARFDAGLLEQALANVLENVGRHTPPGTPVAIVGRIEDGTVRVEVSDAGPGIPIEARERVFAKFQRLADNSFGTGLGLAIARAATSAQGGKVLIEDSPLGGARFVMLVPNQAIGGPSGAS